MAAAARLGALVAIACAVAVAHGHVAHPATGSHVHPDVHELLGHDGHHAPHTFACGVGDPRLEEHFAKDEPGDVRQNYHDAAHPAVKRHLTEHGARGTLGPEMRKLARRMQLSQDYATASGGGFITAGEAHEAGITEGIRILPVWDAIDNGDDDRECHADDVGSTIPNLVTGTHVCAEEDVVTTELREMLEVRTDYAAEYFGEALKIKPVLDDITVLAGLVSEFNLDEDTYEDVDLIMIMTARPAAGLNGYARCRQFDQYGRCTVGEFNWVPTVLDPSKINEPDAIGAQRHTALHEIVHVLGGIKIDPTFIDEEGNTRPVADVWITGTYDSEDYPKVVTKIKTPKVLEMAREHFGCAELEGVPIEDQETGKVAHWEARLLGPELMSYGTGSSETIIGDLTLAYLEDTNQYIANYSMGGRLVEGGADTTRDTVYKIDVTPGDDFTPTTRSPGMLRWGKDLGCDFVQKSAALWPDSYFCKKHKEFGCTPDHRMSAVCTVLAGWSFPNRVFTCGDCPGSETGYGCRPECQSPPNDNCPPSGVGCGLPSMYQYFDAAGAQAAFGTRQAVDPGTTGGFSSAMDFVPVSIGYWNCQDSKAGNGSSLLERQSGGSGFSLATTLSGASDNMKLFGGQAYCPDCRCFVSSLMDFTSGKINPNFPRFGLCYRSNCYRDDYLQFAIESQVGRDTTWYRCPPAGGKLYIAGFSGAFHCPAAEEFCKMETITGIKYTETDPLLEWIILSCIFGSPLLLMICCCFPCFRNRVVGKFRKYCGVDHFDRAGTLYMHSQALAEQDMVEPPEVPGRILIMTNGFIAFLAIAAFFVTMSGVASGRISVAAAFLLTMSLSTLMFSIMGMCAGCKESRGVSCFAVTYLYVVFFSSLFFLFSCMYAVSFPSAMGRIIERQWPKISETVPEGWLPATLAEGEGEELLSTYAAAAFVMAIVLGSILIAELWAIIKVVTIPVMAASMYTVINWVLLVSGLGFFGLAGYTARFAVGGDTSSLSKNVLMVVGFFVFMGVYFVVLSIVELVASHKKTVKWLSVSMCMSVVTMLLTLLGAIVMFQATRDVEDTVGRLTDDQIGEISSALGFTNGSREGVIESLRNNMRTMGMFGMCVIIMMCCLVAANWFFLEHVRRHYARARKAAAAYEDDDQGIAVGVVPHARGGGGGGGRGHRSGGRAGGRSKRPSRAQHSDFI
mmetsp:Transcript_24598/g.85538  ORF Transcript_24598/g.85538 Transcript_24598/m.85538 type:complete len:1188 (-) Transcript_24598:195-3758(-)